MRTEIIVYNLLNNILSYIFLFIIETDSTVDQFRNNCERYINSILHESDNNSACFFNR